VVWGRWCGGTATGPATPTDPDSPRARCCRPGPLSESYLSESRGPARDCCTVTGPVGWWGRAVTPSRIDGCRPAGPPVRRVWTKLPITKERRLHDNLHRGSSVSRVSNLSSHKTLPPHLATLGELQVGVSKLRRVKGRDGPTGHISLGAHLGLGPSRLGSPGSPPATCSNPGQALRVLWPRSAQSKRAARSGPSPIAMRTAVRPSRALGSAGGSVGAQPIRSVTVGRPGWPADRSR
jgi:hypothetical protein